MDVKLAAIVVALAVPLLAAGTVAAQSEPIPSWIKTVATFWGSGTISDAEFTNAMSFLIEEGMISNPSYENARTELETLRPLAAAGLINEFKLAGGDTSILCNFTEKEIHKTVLENVGPVSMEFTKFFLVAACSDTPTALPAVEEAPAPVAGGADIEIVVCREQYDIVEVKGFLTNTGTSTTTYEITFLLYDVYGNVNDFTTSYAWDVRPGERRSVEGFFFNASPFESCEIDARVW